jgi:putative FmdB family regulatory protein
MPVYTYRCQNCGVQFDESQKFVDPPLVKCPECGKKTLRKVFQPVGIVFKGSGFYSTDHRSSSGMSYAASAKADRAESEKKAPEKSDSKDSTSKPESSTTVAPAEKKEATPASK